MARAIPVNISTPNAIGSAKYQGISSKKNVAIAIAKLRNEYSIYIRRSVLASFTTRWHTSQRVVGLINRVRRARKHFQHTVSHLRIRNSFGFFLPTYTQAVSFAWMSVLVLLPRP